MTMMTTVKTTTSTATTTPITTANYNDDSDDICKYGDADFLMCSHQTWWALQELSIELIQLQHMFRVRRMCDI